MSAANPIRANANSTKKRIGGRGALWRPTLDPWRDFGGDEALAGVPDRSRLPGIVHGIGVQLHNSLAASSFGNPAPGAKRIRSPSSYGRCHGGDCDRTHLFALGQAIGRAFESVRHANVFLSGEG